MAAANDLGPAEGPDPQIFDELAAMLDAMPSEVDDKPGAVDEPRPQPPEAAPETPLPVPVTPPDRERAADPPPTDPAGPTSAESQPHPSPPPPPPPPAPPELVVPPRPPRPRGLVDTLSSLFPHVLWLSVIAGLAGQIYGFAEFFGGGVFGWGIAAVLGGVFEFMMVTCSSRGLRAIGENRSWREFVPFLVIGTAAAGFAAYMNVNHFVGFLGLAACSITAIGYLAHVFSHLYDELERRKTLAAWELEKTRVENEIQARAAAERAEYEQYRRAQIQARAEAERAALTAHGTAPPPAAPTPSAPTSPSGSAAPPPAAKTPAKRSQKKSPGRATKAEAVRIGVDQKLATPAALRAGLTEAGYTLPASTSTVENWCRAIKAQLQDNH